ncbi:MAG: hypothetical protein LUO89_03845, partial [Methanothrix sp.]|nr:hypothetical protein [Methanothrix sp.]
MKTTTPFRKHFKTFVIGFSVLAMVLTAAFIVPTTAFAASDTQAVQGTAQAPADHPALTKAFQAEQAFLSRQATHLDNTAAILTKIQNLITQAKGRILDTGALESALTAFQGRVSSARAAHDTASGILSTHAGFNADGSVTNAAEARQTVLDARQSLQSAAT